MKVQRKGLNDYEVHMHLDLEGWEEKLEALRAIALEDLDLYRTDLKLKIEYGRISFAICLPDERSAPNGFSLTAEDLNKLEARDLVNLVEDRLKEYFGNKSLQERLARGGDE